MFARIREGLMCVFERDPAERSVFEVLTTYPGYQALLAHRISQRLWLWKLRWLSRWLSTRAGWLPVVAIGVALFPASIVLLLRAHWTMDVFAGVVTALYVAGLAQVIAPSCDRALARWAKQS